MQRTKDLDTAELLEHLPALQLLLFRVLGCQVILFNVFNLVYYVSIFHIIVVLVTTDEFDCRSVCATEFSVFLLLFSSWLCIWLTVFAGNFYSHKGQQFITLWFSWPFHWYVKFKHICFSIMLANVLD